MKDRIFVFLFFIGVLGFGSIILSAAKNMINHSQAQAAVKEYRRVMCYVSNNTKTTVVFTSQESFLRALDQTFGRMNSYYAWGDCSRYEPHTTPFTPMPAATPKSPATPKPTQTPRPPATARPAQTPQSLATPKPPMTAKPAQTPKTPQTPLPPARPVFVDQMEAKNV